MLRQANGRARVFYKVHDERGLRERFTLGHELGHLVIPWQVGNTTCFTAEGAEHSAPDDELEADTFASCLLAPDRWLDGLISRYATGMSDLLMESAVAEISTTATLLALRRRLPAGWVFRINSQQRFIATPGTRVPDQNSIATRAFLSNHAQDKGSVRLHGNAVHWWRLASEYELPDGGDLSLPARSLLLEAISFLKLSEGQSLTLEQSVNGLVGGGTRELAGRDAGEIYASLRYRFENASYDADFVAHPAFIRWLARKAQQIAEKQR